MDLTPVIELQSPTEVLRIPEACLLSTLVSSLQRPTTRRCCT